MEFKNLAEVELLGEVPEGASVLAATADGNVVRVPGDGLGGGNAGGGQFVVKITMVDQQSATLDKTNEEIWEALNANMHVVGLAEDGNGSTFTRLFFNVTQQMAANGLITFQTMQFVPDMAAVQVVAVTVNTRDEVTVGYGAIQAPSPF